MKRSSFRSDVTYVSEEAARRHYPLIKDLLKNGKFTVWRCEKPTVPLLRPFDPAGYRTATPDGLVLDSVPSLPVTPLKENTVDTTVSVVEKSLNYERTSNRRRHNSTASTWDTMTDEEAEVFRRELRKQEAFKTALCEDWKRSGHCSYGEDCRFAHGDNELRPPPLRGKEHPKYKTQLCDKFSSNGFCPYGQRCQFIHKLKKGLPVTVYEGMVARGEISPERPEQQGGRGKRLEQQQFIDEIVDDYGNKLVTRPTSRQLLRSNITTPSSQDRRRLSSSSTLTASSLHARPQDTYWSRNRPHHYNTSYGDSSWNSSLAEEEKPRSSAQRVAPKTKTVTRSRLLDHINEDPDEESRLEMQNNQAFIMRSGHGYGQRRRGELGAPTSGVHFMQLFASHVHDSSHVVEDTENRPRVPKYRPHRHERRRRVEQPQSRMDTKKKVTLEMRASDDRPNRQLFTRSFDENLLRDEFLSI